MTHQFTVGKFLLYRLPLVDDGDVHFYSALTINLNAQCAGEGGGVDREKATIIKIKKNGHMVQSHSRCRCVFWHLLNTAKEPASLIVGGHSRACEQRWKRLCQFGFFCLALSS